MIEITKGKHGTYKNDKKEINGNITAKMDQENLQTGTHTASEAKNKYSKYKIPHAY
jgi:hypothetical protein